MKSVPSNRSYVPIQFNIGGKKACTAPASPPNPHLRRVAFLVSIGLPLVIAIVCASAVLCLLYDPIKQVASLGGRSIATTNATCLRARRLLHYTSILLSMGSPARELELLLRFDPDDVDDEHAIRTFSNHVLLSRTLVCESRADDSSVDACYDAALISHSPTADLSPVVMHFTHRQADLVRSSVAWRLGLDGEFRLHEGYTYWITNTHVCYAEMSVDTSRSIQAYHRGGSLSMPLETVERSFPNAPVSVYDDAANCTIDDVTFLPTASFLASQWVAMPFSAADGLVNRIIEQRGAVVEVGTRCAEQAPSLYRELKSYKVDCLPYGTCRTEPSVAYRRVADCRMLLTRGKYATNFTFERDHGLRDAIRAQQGSGEFSDSVLILLVILLSAMVVFGRSKSGAPTTAWLFRSAMPCQVHDEHFLKKISKDTSVIEDVAIGIVAVTARLFMTLEHQEALRSDGQQRVCTVQYIGTAASVLHSILRHLLYLFYHRREKANVRPLSLLGGGTAVVDVTCASLIAFARAPLLSSAYRTTRGFDSTARILVGLLACAVALPRCVFAVPSCLMLTVKCDICYAIIPACAGLIWVMEAAITTMSIADLVVTPLAFEATRSSHAPLELVKLCILLCLLATSIPEMNQTTRSIADTTTKKPASGP